MRVISDSSFSIIGERGCVGMSKQLLFIIGVVLLLTTYGLADDGSVQFSSISNLSNADAFMSFAAPKEGDQNLQVEGDAWIKRHLNLSKNLNVGGVSNLSDNLNVTGDVITMGALFSHGGSVFSLGSQDGQNQLKRTLNRALVHNSEPSDSLHLNFDGDFEGGVVIGGPSVNVKGEVVVNGYLRSKSSAIIGGQTIVLGISDGTKQGSKVENRALMHRTDPEDSLFINAGGDFEGGVVIDGDRLGVSGNLGVGTALPQSAVDIVGDTPEIHIRSSRETKNFFFLSAVPRVGGSDLTIGTSASGAGYGRITFKTGSGMYFSGSGNSYFDRGDTAFLNGNVGIGSTTPDFGLSIDTAAAEGDAKNSVAVKKGHLHLWGSITEVFGGGSKYYLHMSKGGNIKALNIEQKLGVGTDKPYGFANTSSVIHVRDEGRPVVKIETTTASSIASIILQNRSLEFHWNLSKSGLELWSGRSIMSVTAVDAYYGAIGFGTSTPTYGLTLSQSTYDTGHRMNDLSLEKGNLRMWGAIYKTHNGGDKYFLDLESSGNINSLNMQGQLLFDVVSSQKTHKIVLPGGDVSINLGGNLFINGSGSSSNISSNSYLSSGKFVSSNAKALASGIVLSDQGAVSMWGSAKGVVATTMFSFNVPNMTLTITPEGGNVGIGGITDPQHTLHLPDANARISLGNNLFLNGNGEYSYISHNGFFSGQGFQAVTKSRDTAIIKFGGSNGTIGAGDMNGDTITIHPRFSTVTVNSAAGKVGIGLARADVAFTLSLPAGDATISLGNNIFINGSNSTGRIANNAYVLNGAWAIFDKTSYATTIELRDDSSIEMYGTVKPGVTQWKKMLGFKASTNSVYASGSFGINTELPKLTLDVRGHINIEDSSRAAVIYYPTSGLGFFIRGADSPETYNASQERFFIKGTGEVGVGTTAPKGHFHVQSSTNIPQVYMTYGGANGGNGWSMQSTGASWIWNTTDDSQEIKMTGPGGSNPFYIFQRALANAKDNRICLLGDGGAMGIGGANKEGQTLEVFGKGILLRGDGENSNISGEGRVSFYADGGGNGFHMDYNAKAMYFRSKSGDLTHMIIHDSGAVCIGTNGCNSSASLSLSNSFVMTNGSYGWTQRVNETTGNLEFIENDAKSLRMVISKDGSIGFGVTASSGYDIEATHQGILLNGLNGDATLGFSGNGAGKGIETDYYASRLNFNYLTASKNSSAKSSPMFSMTDEGSFTAGIPTTVKGHAGIHSAHRNGIAISHPKNIVKSNSSWSFQVDSTDQMLLSYLTPSATVTKQDVMAFKKAGETNDVYVGIGTTLPEVQLHVIGDAYVSGRLQFGNYMNGLRPSEAVQKNGGEQVMSKKEAEETEKLNANAKSKGIEKEAKSTSKPKQYSLLSTETALLAFSKMNAHQSNDFKHAQFIDESIDGTDLHKTLAVLGKMVKDQQATIAQLSERISQLEQSRV